MSQAIVTDLFLYSDDTGIIFQHNATEIKKLLLRDFKNLYDNKRYSKLSIHFDQYTTK